MQSFRSCPLVLRVAGVVATVAVLLLVSVAAIHVVPRPLFDTGDACIACHNGLRTSDGEDVSIGSNWRASMMANSARDPYWQASVQREVLDHPSLRATIEDECSTCHMPMMRFEAKAAGVPGTVLARLPLGSSDAPADRLAADGVSCTTCHQVTAEGLGSADSFNGGFRIDTTPAFGHRTVYGPHVVDSGRSRIMQSASAFIPKQGLHLEQSAMCATCHTLFTTAHDREGRAVGRLPEQVPYQEWRASRFATGDGARSCQSCHMPRVADSLAISGVWGRPRPGLARHDFRGGNFFMLRMLGRYRAELGVEAPPEELEAAAQRAVTHLQSSTARVSIDSVTSSGGQLHAVIAVGNLAGHKFPTAYPSRRAWLHVVIRDRTGSAIFESGALAQDGAIAGNANDENPGSVEPHYLTISRADEVQIYESVMEDFDGRPTTALLSAVRYVKDNRLLPQGFAKASADADIAVHGSAAGDADFIGGSDRVRYVVDVRGREGPYVVEATMRFQPIAFRWARNLIEMRDRPGADAIARFATYYEAMAPGSSVVVHADTATSR
jgi:hypothetical protein